MCLPEEARVALIAVSIDGVKNIDLLVKSLKESHPNAFHSEDSLGSRTFFHEPKHGEPHRRYLFSIIERKVERG